MATQDVSLITNGGTEAMEDTLPTSLDTAKGWSNGLSANFGYNGSLWVPFEMIDDGTNERVAVDAKIVGGTFQLSPFIPVVVVDETGVTLNISTYETLLDVSGFEGKFDFMAAAGSSANYQVRVTVDTVEIFDVPMADLGAIGLSNATNVLMWAETANKNFRYHPNEGVDFTDSLKVEALATSATPLLKSLISYRKKN